MANRRCVTIKNHDTAAGIWIKEVGIGIQNGGFLGPNESFSIPLSSACKVYAIGINPAGQNITFYQFGTLHS